MSGLKDINTVIIISGALAFDEDDGKFYVRSGFEEEWEEKEPNKEDWQALNNA